MAFRYKLVHHPEASADYRNAMDYFSDVDEDLAALFAEDFKTALQLLATGRTSGTLYATNFAVRWTKLRRFSHKIFFEPEGDDARLVLTVISGKRHPARIRESLARRRERDR